MLYSLDLTATGSVSFVYSLKKAKTDIFSVSAHCPPFKLVTELPDSTRRGEGWVAVRGGWAGLSQHPSRPFSPNYTLKIPGATLWIGWKRRPLPASANYFEIDPKERAYKTLLSARNLIEVVREPQEYVINILPRKLAKDEIVPGEHYTVKELPLYQEAKEADAERRRKLLEDRDQKKLKALSGRLPDRRGAGPSFKENSRQEGEASEKAWEGCEGTHSSQGSRLRVWLTWLRKLHLSNHPGNLNPDADAAETAPLEEAGAESQSQPSDNPDRLAIVLVKGSPPQEAARPAIIPAEVHPDLCVQTKIWGFRFRDKSYLLLPPLRRNLLTIAAPASPFSYAELEVKLKQITPDWKPSSPLLRSGEGPPQHVSTTRSFYSAAADCRLYEDLLLSAPRD
ncbi:hypothetical protein CK203_000811 [Vitis vinifera]|uniref:Uncharacterized protein n=1 Tax=Vitis vinifera TaxID=29760 RepID=A0A438KRC7_VITVI|nr:hypothetical protein CK203_000811 [Vitis vinifera]